MIQHTVLETVLHEIGIKESQWYFVTVFWMLSYHQIIIDVPVVPRLDNGFKKHYLNKSIFLFSGLEVRKVDLPGSHHLTFRTFLVAANELTFAELHLLFRPPSHGNLENK